MNINNIFNSDNWKELLEQETNNLFNVTLDKLLENRLEQNSIKLTDNLFYINSYISKIGLNENKDILQVYYLGVLKTLFKLQFEIVNKCIKEHKLNDILKIKYIKEFIQYLYVNSMPTQSEVAEHLSIEVNTLSNFLKRINKYSLYSVQKLGKQKHFSITKKGWMLYEYIIKNNL